MAYECRLYFCKQKTAYEMLRSLVGSEMCIRDSYLTLRDGSLAGQMLDLFRLVQAAVVG